MIPNKAVVISGQFVSERVAQVVQAITDYCPEIEVQWIPPETRAEGDAAFRILHFPVGGEPYVICHVQTEEEFDTRILKRIIAGDQRNGTLKYGEIEAAEEAAKRMARQRVADEQAEMIDQMYHVFKTPLNTYVVNKDLVIKDGIPFNAKRLGG